MDFAKYTQYRERAARYLNDMANELSMMYGFEAFSMSVHGPLVDLITAYYIQCDATRQLGDLEAIAYAHAASDTALMKKIGRLLLARSHEFTEAAVMGVARAKDEDRVLIENAWQVARTSGTPESKRRLVDATERLADFGRLWTQDSLNRFSDHRVRVV